VQSYVNAAVVQPERLPAKSLACAFTVYILPSSQDGLVKYQDVAPDATDQVEMLTHEAVLLFQ
jgi:hypothetical protein